MGEPNRAVIAIVGRPNVGKSTLFNRLVGGKPALMHDTPGLTRDRRYGTFDFGRYFFEVIDTGGLDPEAEKEVIGAGIHRQAEIAMDEADIIWFVVSGTDQLTPEDEDIARKLRKQSTPVVLVVNKVDSAKRETLAADFYRMGMEHLFSVSAIHGRGIDDVVEHTVERLEIAPLSDEELAALDEEEEEELAIAEDGAGDTPSVKSGRPTDRPLRIAILGKPNVGKSSLMNQLLGEERTVVHDQAGTTTDPVEVNFWFGDTEYTLVDTAGVRRRAKVKEDIEKLSAMMAIDQAKKADVSILMIDATIGATSQDSKLMNELIAGGTSFVVAMNKADLLTNAAMRKEAKEKTQDELHFATWAPMVFLSVLRGTGIAKLIDAVEEVAEYRYRRVGTAELNRFFQSVIEAHPPRVHKGKVIKLQYITQVSTAPPAFVLYGSRSDAIAPAYRKYVKNKLRSTYKFVGSPIRLFVRSRKKTPKSSRR